MTMDPIIGVDKATGSSKTYYVLMFHHYEDAKVLDVFEDLEKARAAHHKVVDRPPYYGQLLDATKKVESSYCHYVVRIEKK